MISKRRKAGLVLMVIFTMSVIFTMTGQAASETQTVQITQTEDDGFITEVGIGIDSDLLTILDPNMDIRAHLHFRGIEINSWEFLDNATLVLTSASTLPFDNESSVTVYGVKQGDFQGASGDAVYGSDSWLSFPLTEASVNVNTSQFYGGAVLEIDISEIIEELIRAPAWDGDGTASVETGDDMGIIILGAEGSDTRYFYDYRGDPNRAARLEIGWGSTPTGGPPGAEFNETNRDFNIWVIDHNGENRTGGDPGAGYVNWNNVNQSDIIEHGAKITVNTDTWSTQTDLRAQDTVALYNDTGATAISRFFSRFSINVTGVTNTDVTPQPMVGLTGISSLSPSISDGHAYDLDPGKWAGVVAQVHQDDVRWRLYLRERSGMGDANYGFSPYFTENDQIWVEFYYKDDGAAVNYFTYSIFNDPDFALNHRVYSWTADITIAGRFFRYPQLISSAGPILGNERYDGEFYTFLDFELPANETWIVTYPNGTVVDDDCPSYDCAITLIDELLGPDPADPDPPSQGWDLSGPFQRFRVRLYILMIGFVLVFGPLIVWAMSRPSGYEFVIGAFIMFIGFALMYAAAQV